MTQDLLKDTLPTELLHRGNSRGDGDEVGWDGCQEEADGQEGGQRVQEVVEAVAPESFD